MLYEMFRVSVYWDSVPDTNPYASHVCTTRMNRPCLNLRTVTVMMKRVS